MNLECSGKLVIGITKCYAQKCNAFFRKEKNRSIRLIAVQWIVMINHNLKIIRKNIRTGYND